MSAAGRTEERARDLVRESLRIGAPGLAEPIREGVVRSIILKLRGHGLLAEDRPGLLQPQELEEITGDSC